MRGLSGTVTVLAVLLAVPLQGQAGPGGQRGMRGQGPMMGGFQPMGMRAADRLIRLREELNLADEQVESLKSTEEADREAHDGARLQIRGMRDQLRDGEITQGQFLDLMTAQRNAMMQQQNAYREQIDAILTDEQKDQLQSLRGGGAPDRGMRRGRGPGRGRGFRRGPGGRGGFGGRGMGRAAGFRRARLRTRLRRAGHEGLRPKPDAQTRLRPGLRPRNLPLTGSRARISTRCPTGKRGGPPQGDPPRFRSGEARL